MFIYSVILAYFPKEKKSNSKSITSSDEWSKYVDDSFQQYHWLSLSESTVDLRKGYVKPKILQLAFQIDSEIRFKEVDPKIYV